MPKQLYFKQFSLVNYFKWFHVLLCITNNSIKHQSFVHTQLNLKIVLFQTVKFSISTELVLFYPLIGPYQVLIILARVDMGAMAIKGYSVFPNPPALLESHYQIV